MKRGWTVRPLDEVCEFRNGLWKGKKPPYVHVGVIRNTNFTAAGYLDDSDIAYLDVDSKQFATRQLQHGDIILEKSGGGPKQPVGRVILFEKKDGAFSFSNFTSVIRVKIKCELDSRFLHKALFYYYVSGVTESMQRRSTGIRNLEFGAYKQLLIPLPPLPEQHRIVAILDQAFAGIAAAAAHAEKSLASARELFETYLNGVFSRKGEGWLEKKLGDIATFRNGINYTKQSRGETIKVVGVKNFQKHYWAPLDELDSAILDGELAESDELKENDILSVRSNGNLELIGRTLLVGKVRGKISHSGFTIRIRLNDNNIVPQYLCHIMKSTKARRDLIDGGIGTNIKSLNQATLMKLAVPIPPAAEQVQIVKLLSALSAETTRLAALYERKLALLAELKQSLLAKAFSGELTADGAEEAVA